MKFVILKDGETAVFCESYYQASREAVALKKRHIASDIALYQLEATTEIVQTVTTKVVTRSCA